MDTGQFQADPPKVAPSSSSSASGPPRVGLLIAAFCLIVAALATAGSSVYWAVVARDRFVVASESQIRLAMLQEQRRQPRSPDVEAASAMVNVVLGGLAGTGTRGLETSEELSAQAEILAGERDGFQAKTTAYQCLCVALVLGFSGITCLRYARSAEDRNRLKAVLGSARRAVFERKRPAQPLAAPVEPTAALRSSSPMDVSKLPKFPS